jgi:Uma2 family endonuclease
MGANVTRAGEGFDRRSFTVADILRMQDGRIITENEHFERIEGEIVPMQAKTHTHELVKSALAIAVARTLPDRGLKARLSTRHGVNELWVIDAERRRTFVHSTPSPAGCRTIVERGGEEALALAALPGFSARLGSI